MGEPLRQARNKNRYILHNKRFGRDARIEHTEGAFEASFQEVRHALPFRALGRLGLDRLL